MSKTFMLVLIILGLWVVFSGVAGFGLQARPVEKISKDRPAQITRPVRAPKIPRSNIVNNFEGWRW